MARLAALSEQGNLNFGQDYVDSTMVTMPNEVMDADRDSVQLSLDSFRDYGLGDGSSEHSSRVHDPEQPSSSRP